MHTNAMVALARSEFSARHLRLWYSHCVAPPLTAYLEHNPNESSELITPKSTRAKTARGLDGSLGLVKKSVGCN